MKYFLTLLLGLAVGYELGFKDSHPKFTAMRCYTTGPFKCEMRGTNSITLNGYGQAFDYKLIVIWENQ